MGRFVPATGIFTAVAKSAQLSDLLSAAYVDVIGSKWGIYRGQSHMPYGETQVEEFKWDGRRYEITIWPNDQQDIEEENRFREAPYQISRPGTIVALGIFNYSVPWLDWYVRSHPFNTQRHWDPEDDVWTEVTMVQREGVRRSSSAKAIDDYMEMTDKERLYHKEWEPKTDVADDDLEMGTAHMMSRLREQQDEFADTNITYLSIRDIGTLGFPPLNWPYNPPRHQST
jgi:hypothetical protein